MADARWVPVSTGLTFHFSEAVRPGSIRITLIGSEGGVYQASIQATRDNRTLVAHPTRPFAMNETVTVTLAGTNGMRRTWSFHTVPRAIPDDVIARMDEAMLEEFTNPEPTRKSSEDRSFPWRSLDETETVVPPVTMPEFEVTNPGGASDGVVYVQAFNYPTSGSERFNFVLSNEGDLLYYESFIEQIPFDFHPHDNVSRIHYFIYPDRQIHVMDTTWTIVDTITAENGYRLDPHECLLIEDGSYWLIAQDIRIVDMSEVVEGGDEEASVIGMVVQHVDADQNVLFEWRSLDHIPVTDADLVYVDLTEEYIDYCHTNSIELDSDTSLVISSRNISEATRISRETGDVLWRLSGTGNQFEFVDDPNPGFAIQHDARILDNGHLTIFNNGGHEFDAISSVKEYELDTEAMTARLVWSYQNDELGTIGWKMGSARRMPNGNTLIGWGAARNNRPYYPIASEIDMEGNVLWQLDFAEEGSGDLISYRAYRSSIRGRAAKPYLYALWYGDDADVWLNYFGHEETSSFRLSYGIRGSGTSETVTTDEGYLSLTDLDPDEEYELTMVALDGEGGESEVSNTVYIHWNENDVADEKPGELPATITLHDVWPNPFNATTTAQIELGRTSEVQMSLVNLLGREVTMLNQGRMSAGVHRLSIGGEHLASGVYFLRVVSQGEVVGTRKLVLLR
ncbi:aryl-sulfate sulfotransferase [bacterium]|nr:aryl-sulfate sulfotransferase [bacterium]